ncbi:unnamed protein product [Mytilus edulis]|uniref:Uncharacterized protein n=1 Tax=Mytilus edulis TaxID=6550 RepID=A0A8S3TIB2_MYTED|nr:unnamed protein product [Mytilus edulis]
MYNKVKKDTQRNTPKSGMAVLKYLTVCAIIFVLGFEFTTAAFIPDKDFLQMQDHHMSNYKNIFEQYTGLADGPDNSLLRVYVRPNTQIVYRNERNERHGRLNSESFGDQRLPRNRWPSHDDTDSFTKHHDHSIIKPKKMTERRDNTFQTVVSEMEKQFKKSSKSIFSRANDLFSDQTTEKRVYGIKDFVHDFLKIVSN